ncbi:MAG: NUDIX hydrolase [Paenibacillaceae bacterium]
MSDPNKFKEITLNTTPIFQGKIISLQVDEVRLPNGETATREIVKHPGAVAVLAIHAGKMVVVEQFRKPLEKSIVEIPAGKLEPGENPLEAAHRELQEETGFTSPSLTLIHSFYTAPGFTDEIIHLYYADQLTAGADQPDEDEFLECESITLEEAKQMVVEGRISDAKTIIAMQAWELYKLTGHF